MYDDFKYITLEQSIHNNGHRHLERAISYASAQWPEHYVKGSLKKAERNFKRANEIEFPFDPIVNTILQPMIDNLNKRIADDVMLYGQSWSRHNADGTVEHIGLQNILYKEIKCQKCLNVLLSPYKWLKRSLSM